MREAEGFYLKPIFDWGGGLSMAYVVQIGAKFLWNLRGHIGSFKSPFKCGLVYPKKCALETICSCPISDFKVWATTNCGEQSSRRGGIRKGEFHWNLLRGISFCLPECTFCVLIWFSIQLHFASSLWVEIKYCNVEMMKREKYISKSTEARPTCQKQ